MIVVRRGFIIVASHLACAFVGGVGSAFIWVNHVPFLSDNAHPSRRAEALVIWSALQVVIRMLLSLAGGFLPDIMGYFLGTSTEMPEPSATRCCSVPPSLLLPYCR